ncbi:MAG: DUF21 domain-containing protein, partial [Bradyrhizobium sp.]
MPAKLEHARRVGIAAVRLNLAVFSLSLLRLQIEADSGNANAARVLELRRHSNQILATIIWGNVTTNVLLTLLSDSV